MKRVIAFPHRPSDIGGPGTFQQRFEAALLERGWTVAYAGDRRLPDVIFIVGGTRRLLWVVRNKLVGVKVVQRLDGINWLHRARYPGPRRWVLSESQNLLMAIVRKWLAGFVVYQSEFVSDWWCREYGNIRVPTGIIYNGVDLSVFSPCPVRSTELLNRSVICAEGNIDGEIALAILKGVRGCKVKVYGNVSPSLAASVAAFGSDNIEFMGRRAREEMPSVLKDRQIFLSLDINAACPNAVIEAMSSGLPIVGFDTGSLRELVGEKAGILVPYGGNAWSVEEPHTHQLQVALESVFEEYERFSIEARCRAVQLFDIRIMVDKYLAILEAVCGSERPATS